MRAPTVRARCLPPPPTLSFCGGTAHATSDRADSESSRLGGLCNSTESNTLFKDTYPSYGTTSYHLPLKNQWARAGGLPASGLKTASENKGEKSILPVWKICSLVISDNQSTLLYIEWNCKTMMYILSWLRSLIVFFCSNIDLFFRFFIISARGNYIVISSNGNT